MWTSWLRRTVETAQHIKGRQERYYLGTFRTLKTGEYDFTGGKLWMRLMQGTALAWPWKKSRSGYWIVIKCKNLASIGYHHRFPRELQNRDRDKFFYRLNKPKWMSGVANLLSPLRYPNGESYEVRITALNIAICVWLVSGSSGKDGAGDNGTWEERNCGGCWSPSSSQVLQLHQDLVTNNIKHC